MEIRLERMRYDRNLCQRQIITESKLTMKLYQSVLAFIGNFSPIFAITYIVYEGLLVNIYLLPVLVTVLCNLVWVRLLDPEYLEQKCEHEQYEIAEVEDLGKDVIAYFLSYSISLPSALFLSPEKGLIVLFIILTMIFVLFYRNKIMLFNPFLSVRGYYELEAKTKEGVSIYLISKRRIENNNVVNLYRLNEYFYIENIKFSP